MRSTLLIFISLSLHTISLRINTNIFHVCKREIIRYGIGVFSGIALLTDTSFGSCNFGELQNQYHQPNHCSIAKAAGFYEKPLINSIDPFAVFNFPSDDFWHPPFFIGEWKMDLRFNKAELHPNLPPVEQLVSPGRKVKDIVPGLEDYTVFMLPKIGEDVENVPRRYIQLDSHPREDHSFNLRALVSSIDPNTKVDKAPYSYQKMPDWFHSRSSYWKVLFTKTDKENSDRKVHGKVEFFTKKRRIDAFVGKVRTIEYIHQELTPDVDAHPDQKIASDYAVEWQMSAPAALRDEFISEEALAMTDVIIGKLNIHAYFQKDSDFYNRLTVGIGQPQPAAVYSYDVRMVRALPDMSSTIYNTNRDNIELNTKLSPTKTYRTRYQELFSRTKNPIVTQLMREDAITRAKLQMTDEERMLNEGYTQDELNSIRSEEMKRQQRQLLVESTTYPYIFRDEGPVELQEYFGY